MRACVRACVPADVVGPAGVPQGHTVGFVPVLVGADGDDGLAPPLLAC